MEITWRVISGRQERENRVGGEGTENKKHTWKVQNRQGEVKNSIGSGEAEEHICITHGHELRWSWGEILEGGGAGRRRRKGRKKLGQL